ncbi:hypothetical protein NS44R_14775 [Mammaliicoccus sciuri]|nr:hypothetical protein NS44R_14775 [Mammaliicoccus sciuri]
MLGRDQARVHQNTALADCIVMIAGAVIDTAQLGDAHAAAEDAVLHPPLLEGDDAMDDAVQLKTLRVVGEIIERQDGALLIREETLQGQQLAAVA